MKMKFLGPFAALLLLPALVAAQSACPVLVITGHPTYMPVAWAADGKIAGAASELVTGIAKKSGVTTVASKDYGSWESAQAAVARGEADVIFGIYKNDERMTWLDYVEPAFMMDPVSVVVRKGDGFVYALWDDLKGRKGVTNAGESFGTAFDGFMAKNLTVARAQGVDKAFAALLNKSADYLIIGLYPGSLEARRLGIGSKVEFLSKEIDSFGMYVGFSKKSKCNELKAAFAEGLKQEVADGRVKVLLDAARRQLEK